MPRRIFPFHPICRGSRTGKRSDLPAAAIGISRFSTIGSSGHTTLSNPAGKDTDRSKNLYPLRTYSHLLRTYPTLLRTYPEAYTLYTSPNLAYSLCTDPKASDNKEANTLELPSRKYAFAPKCRGTTSKRAMFVGPPEQVNPVVNPVSPANRREMLAWEEGGGTENDLDVLGGDVEGDDEFAYTAFDNNDQIR
jgi:hypothetical protein